MIGSCIKKQFLRACSVSSGVITSPGPKDVVQSYIGGTDFHANKIRVKYKKSDPKQIAFCDLLSPS